MNDDQIKYAVLTIVGPLKEVLVGLKVERTEVIPHVTLFFKAGADKEGIEILVYKIQYDLFIYRGVTIEFDWDYYAEDDDGNL